MQQLNTDKLEGLLLAYQTHKGKGLKLDMTRGKPSPEQLALSEPLLQITNTQDRNLIDCRNYGDLTGLPDTRKLFGEYLGVPAEGVVIGGNSSLTLMHDIFVQCLLTKWSLRDHSGESGRLSFLCPVPGYDRHFAICEKFGVRMIPVKMTEDGPDMEAVFDLVRNPSVVGIWCVPVYSNPTGAIYNDDVIDGLARMNPANPNFRIFWDNAYAVHHLRGKTRQPADIYDECSRYDAENRVFTFGSTSKITFAGGGISAVGMSPGNLEWYLQGLQAQTIGPDKLNQLRHTLFLGDMKGIQRHMEKHAKILLPKFEAVNRVFLKHGLSEECLAKWTCPDGGYFISLDVWPGCAKRVVELAGAAGVKLTPAGATFPYRDDLDNQNIRIAPSFPPVQDVETAMETVALCIQIASLEKLVKTMKQ